MQIKQSRPFVGFSYQTITANMLKYCRLAVFSCDHCWTSALKTDLIAFVLQIYKIIKNHYNILQIIKKNTEKLHFFPKKFCSIVIFL